MELVWPVLIVGERWFDVPVVLAWWATGIVVTLVILKLTKLTEET